MGRIQSHSFPTDSSDIQNEGEKRDRKENTESREKGSTHRVIFLPRFFTLPGGRLDLEDETVTYQTYQTQRVLVQMPSYEIYLENMSIYAGPIAIDTPAQATCLVTLDSVDGNGRLRVVRLSVEVEDGTYLRFWPPGTNDQIVQAEYELQAASKHAVRGEISGNHEHLIRNLYEMITFEDRKLFYRGKKYDLRRSAILKAAVRTEIERKQWIDSRKEHRIDSDRDSDSDEDSIIKSFCVDQCDCTIL